MKPVEVPLFPLHTVLFPGSRLPLQIFEKRYLDMISACLKQDGDFGIAAIRSGEEAGEAASSFAYGTLARIVDWQTLDNGLLGISVEGRQRFEILDRSVAGDNLITAKIRLLPEPAVKIPEPSYGQLRALLGDVLRSAPPDTAAMTDASWVGYRISELLPLDNAAKTELLAMVDPLQRLDTLERLLAGLRAGR